MNIVTKREVIYDNDYNYSNACGCSGFDGSKATTSQIKDFQFWYNLKNTPRLRTDGTLDAMTKSAISAKGNEYDLSKGFSVSTATKLPNNVSETSPVGEKKKGMLWDKAKGTWVKGSDWLNRNPEFKNRLQTTGGNLLGNLFGGIFGGSQPIGSDAIPEYTTSDTAIKDDGKKSTMSTPVKIAIGVGAAALLITIIVVATKKK